MVTLVRTYPQFEKLRGRKHSSANEVFLSRQKQRLARYPLSWGRYATLNAQVILSFSLEILWFMVTGFFSVWYWLRF
jgi:hypothetical protein